MFGLGRTYKQQQGEGRWAFLDGLELSDNPYADGAEGEESDALAEAWESGYVRESRLFRDADPKD